MTGQRLGKCIILCLLPWSCLSVAWSSAAGPTTALPATGHIGKRLPRDFANGTYEHSNISAQCTALIPPHHGHYYVDRGSGVSVGSVIVYWCEEGYRLVGSERLSCLQQESTSSWSHPTPHCEAVPPPTDTGSRVAVAAALVSGAVILALAASFAVCCWRERARRSRGVGQLGRKPGAGRMGDGSAARRGRKAFGRLKRHHRRDYHLSVFPGAFAGCDNVAFQRSPDRPPQCGSQPGAWLWPQLAPQPRAAPRRGELRWSSPSRQPCCLQAQPGPGRIVLLPGCYRSYAEHSLSNTCGKAV
ncbi:sushi domain-containing protein 3-like [Cyrtonyx montezumae]|uniref:sushi domain-containing protein 3-like n=1 Tax=Cyrtonyx montezumae TaxID=9017 RepID=UPI0032DA453D